MSQKIYVNHAYQFKPNVDRFIMKFLEETVWRENNIIFLDQFKLMSGKIWMVNEEQNFFIRSYRVEIKVSSGGDHRRLKEEAKRRLVSRIGHSVRKYRASRLWIDQVTIVALAITSWWTQGDRSWRVDKLSALQGKKAKKGKELKSDLKSTRLRVAIYIRSKSFLILSYQCIRYWNPSLLG